MWSGDEIPCSLLRGIWFVFRVRAAEEYRLTKEYMMRTRSLVFLGGGVNEKQVWRKDNGSHSREKRK